MSRVGVGGPVHLLKEEIMPHFFFFIFTDSTATRTMSYMLVTVLKGHHRIVLNYKQASKVNLL